ncbi:MAG: Holliday junction resolvase RuvX [Dehalococcoidia bacterium]|nr:Holliday junction resolvase RuvX [Dehalococcoidia bacterium]
MRWLCLDPGVRRTGVAISSPEGTFAVPLVVIEHDASGPPLERVERLVQEHGVGGLVIGLPLSMDGTTTAQTALALEFAVRVASYFDAHLEAPAGIAVPASDPGMVRMASDAAPESLRVLLWDERLSSWEAQRMTAAGEAVKRKRLGKARPIDAHAAAVILQSYLDAHQLSWTPGKEPESFTGEGPGAHR